MNGRFTAALMLALTATSASAADYPNRAIHIVVPWPAGGPSDAVARILGQELSDTLHQPVIIDNKAGATGSIGSDYVAKASPDGYTIVVANTASHTLLKVENPKLSYDPLKDFKPIIEYGNYPVALMMNAALPVRTLQDFIAFSKSTSGGVLLGTPGTGSVSHVNGVLLQIKTGAQITFVPYRGDAPARLDLLAGNIHGIMGSPDFELIAAGKARLIGSTGTTRWPQAPDVPTFAEAGYPDITSLIHWGFAAPAATPDDAIKILNEAINKALTLDRVKKVLIDNGYFPLGGAPEVLSADFAKQTIQFEDIFKTGAIKLE